MQFDAIYAEGTHLLVFGHVDGDGFALGCSFDIRQIDVVGNKRVEGLFHSVAEVHIEILGTREFCTLHADFEFHVQGKLSGGRQGDDGSHFVLSEGCFSLHAEFVCAQRHVVQCQVGEGVAGEGEIDGVGGCLEQRDLAVFKGEIGFIERGDVARVFVVHHEEGTFSFVAFAQHFVAEVNDGTFQDARVDGHFFLEIVILHPRFAGKGKCGEGEIVVAENDVVKVVVVVKVNLLEVVVAQIESAQIRVVRDVNLGEVVACGEEIHQVRVLRHVQ